MLDDGWVICNHCHKPVKVDRPFGTGSAYAKKWKELPPKAKQVCLVWVSHDDLWGEDTKNNIFYKMQRYGLKLSIRSFNQRISELLAIRLIEMTQHGIREEHETKVKPAYIINLTRMLNVINKGGRLECTEQ